MDYDIGSQDSGEHESISADDINIDDYLSDDEVPDYRYQSNNYSGDDEDKQVPYASGISFTQFLLDQLHTLRMSEEEQQIAEFLVGSIDDSGYIRRAIPDIMDDLAFTQNVYTTEEKIEKVLKLVQFICPGI